MKVVNYCVLLQAALATTGRRLLGDADEVARVTTQLTVAPLTVAPRYPIGGGTVCTADAKICPNGRSVGRTGPNCEWAPCDDYGGYNPYYPNPYYPGVGSSGSCSTHSQCGSGQYCYSCSQCFNTPGCTITPTCRSRPSAGDCAPTANCYRDRDPIDGRCPSGGVVGGGGINPCAVVLCPYGKVCVPSPKVCITTPCEQYSCEYPGGGGGTSPCSVVSCPRGQVCVPDYYKQCYVPPCDNYRCEYPGGVSNPCIAATCPFGTTCVRDGYSFRCDDNNVGSGGSCAAVTCPYGQRCVPQRVTCVRWPCPPQYRCEPYGGVTDNPCYPNPCPYNQRCVTQTIYCIAAPCPQQYRCIGGGGGGGGNNCGENEEWESCGSSSCWEDKCSNGGAPWPPQACTFDCRSGCRCKSGYKRNWDGTCTLACFVIGRPFSTEKGGFLVAPVLSTPTIETQVPTETSCNATGLLGSGIPEEHLTQAAAYWAKIAMMEHASVASFSRFSLELMSVGAPPELLALVHQAALDEVRHTQVALNLAKQFSGSTYAPGALPLSTTTSDFAFGDLEKIATSAAVEGCIEETLAAAVAMYQADHMGDAEHRGLLRSVALDEATHAALAWRAVQWLTNNSPEIHKAVSAVFVARAARYASPPARASEPVLQHLGLLDQGTMEKLQHAAWNDVVVPAAASLGFLSTSEANSRGGQIANIITQALASCNQAMA